MKQKLWNTPDLWDKLGQIWMLQLDSGQDVAVGLGFAAGLGLVPGEAGYPYQ